MLGESKTLAWGFAMAPHRLRALVVFELIGIFNGSNVPSFFEQNMSLFYFISSGSSLFAKNTRLGVSSIRVTPLLTGNLPVYKGLCHVDLKPSRI